MKYLNSIILLLVLCVSAFADPTFNNVGTAAHCGSCTSLANGTLPTHSVGDLLILEIAANKGVHSGETVSCTGYTAITHIIGISGNTNDFIAAFYRIATGSDTTTCTYTTTEDWVELNIAAYTGAAASSPIDVSATINSDQANSGSCDSTHCFSGLVPSGQHETAIFMDSTNGASSGNTINSCDGFGSCSSTLPTRRWISSDTGISMDEWDLSLGTSTAITRRYDAPNAFLALNFLICPTGGCVLLSHRQNSIIFFGGPSLLQSCIGTAENPGDNVAADVAAASSGTTFCLAAGTYRGQSIVPKVNDKFIGATGADLNGSIVLSTWNTLSGPIYYNQVEASTCSLPLGAIGSCNDGTIACRYPQDVYIDSVPVTRTLTYPPTNNRFYFDQTNSQGHGVAVYINSNPSGHTIELGCSTSAFISAASGVTIKGLTIEKYANQIGIGAVNINSGGNNWMISSNTVKLNHSTGVAVRGDNTSVLANTLNENGNFGTGLGGGNNDLWQNNVINYNGYAGVNYGFGAGGSKFSAAGTFGNIGSKIQILNNEFGYNNGTGLGSDVDNYYTLFQNNNIHNNLGDGVRYEISHFGTIVNNTLLDNAELWPGQCIAAHIPILNGNDFCTGPGTMSVTHTCTQGGVTELPVATSGNTTVGGGPGLGNSITSNCGGIGISAGGRNQNNLCVGSQNPWLCCSGINTGNCDGGMNDIVSYNTIDITSSPLGPIHNRFGGNDTNSPTILFNNGSFFNHNTYKVHSLSDTNWNWCDFTSSQWNWAGFTSLGGCSSHPAQEANGTIISMSPSPPILVNPQNPNDYGADPTGVADSTAAFQAAQNAGDLQVTTGVYLINHNGVSGSGVSLSNGRNIRCGTGTTADGTIALKYTQTNAYNMFIWNNPTSGSVFGCQFRGPNYNAAGQPIEQGNSEQFFFLQTTNTSGLAGNVSWVNNDFNGIGGFTGAISVYASSTNQPPTKNNLIGWNTFEHCGRYAIQLASTINTSVEFNTLSDCNGFVEADNTGQANTGNLINHNSVAFPHGSGAGPGTFNSYLTCGASASGGAYNYSGNTCDSNTCTGPVSSSLLESAIGGSGNNAIYTNDTVSNGCVVH